MGELGDLAKRTKASIWNHEGFTKFKQHCFQFRLNKDIAHHCFMAIASKTWSNSWTKNQREGHHDRLYKLPITASPSAPCQGQTVLLPGPRPDNGQFRGFSLGHLQLNCSKLKCETPVSSKGSIKKLVLPKVSWLSQLCKKTRRAVAKLAKCDVPWRYPDALLAHWCPSLRFAVLASLSNSIGHPLKLVVTSDRRNSRGHNGGSVGWITAKRKKGMAIRS